MLMNRIDKFYSLFTRQEGLAIIGYKSYPWTAGSIKSFFTSSTEKLTGDAVRII
jgi:hypothetical protein